MRACVVVASHDEPPSRESNFMTKLEQTGDENFTNQWIDFAVCLAVIFFLLSQLSLLLLSSSPFNSASVGVHLIKCFLLLSSPVTAPLSVFISPQHSVVDALKSASLNCSISGFPISDVKWLKDGAELKVDGVRLKLVQGTVLKIHEMQREDQGMYQVNKRSCSYSVPRISY